MQTNGVSINLTTEKSLEIFYNALCNVYGNGYWNGYGLIFSDVSNNGYADAKARLLKDSPKIKHCYEDIILQAIKSGESYTVIDEEGGGEYTRSINLQDICDQVKKSPIKNISNILNESDDIIDSDVILQTVFFDSVIFG